MKILFLADAESSHTQKWVLSILNHGVEIFLFSLNSISPELQKVATENRLTVYSAKQGTKANKSILNKLSYLKVIPLLSKEIKQFKPDLIHAHYISSYGLLAFLSRFKPYVLSVWGSDIMVFPKKSKIHKETVRMVLNGASRVYATSKLMQNELNLEFNNNNNLQIPFGVNVNKFKPNVEKAIGKSIDFVIVKSLMPTYGIDIAIIAFKKLIVEHNEKNPRLLIYGDGFERKNYEKLSGESLNKSIFFKGRIPHSEVPLALNKASVFVNISRNESFGVSVLEASSCGIPVIVSKEGGLLETVLPNKTALVLSKLNCESCYKTMKQYLLDLNLRKEHGTNGRQFVVDNFDFEISVKKQLHEYLNIIKLKN
jgi:glycosyltransferase involved in cell wall biosynthesis